MTHKSVHFYVLNFNARELKKEYLQDKSMPCKQIILLSLDVRLNFAPHAYVFPEAKPGKEYKEDGKLNSK